jgi:hypothetical protein
MAVPKKITYIDSNTLKMIPNWFDSYYIREQTIKRGDRIKAISKIQANKLYSQGYTLGLVTDRKAIIIHKDKNGKTIKNAIQERKYTVTDRTQVFLVSDSIL